MHYTLEALIDGSPVQEWYRTAADHWRQVLPAAMQEDSDAIAGIAESEQLWFERNCGGRRKGQEVMVVTGIARYYTSAVGFDDTIDAAQAMYDGLIKSRCSVEIHSHARKMANVFPELVERDEF